MPEVETQASRPSPPGLYGHGRQVLEDGALRRLVLPAGFLLLFLHRLLVRGAGGVVLVGVDDAPSVRPPAETRSLDVPGSCTIFLLVWLLVGGGGVNIRAVKSV